MRVANLVVATSAAILATVAIVEAATLPSPTLTLVARGDAASNNPTAISTPLSTAVSTASSSVLSITTPAPSVKGVQAALIGSSWVPALKGFTTYYCPVGQVWHTMGDHAACCPDDAFAECEMAVSCVSTSLMVGADGAFTHTCSGIGAQSRCITGLVTGLGTILTNMQCWNTWNGTDWDATKTEILTSTSSPTAASSATPVPVASLTNPIPPSLTPSHKSNIGPIAGGAATGGVLLPLAIGLLIFLWRRRRRNQHRDTRSRQPSTVSGAGTARRSWLGRRQSKDEQPKRNSTSTEGSGSAARTGSDSTAGSGTRIQLNPVASIPSIPIETGLGQHELRHEAGGNGILKDLDDRGQRQDAEIHEFATNEKPVELDVGANSATTAPPGHDRLGAGGTDVSGPGARENDADSIFLDAQSHHSAEVE